MTEVSEAELSERVRATIGKVFRLSPAQAAGDLQLGNPTQWDSLGHMQMLVEIEREFGVRFQTHEIAGLANVEKIVQAVQAHLAAG